MDLEKIIEIVAENNTHYKIEFIMFLEKEVFNNIIHIFKKYGSVFDLQDKTWEILKSNFVYIEGAINDMFKNYTENTNYTSSNIIDNVSDYLKTLDDDNRRLENLNNLIKFCRTWAIKLQQESIK